MVPFSGMYDALKAKTFDGQSDPLAIVQSLGSTRCSAISA